MCQSDIWRQDLTLAQKPNIKVEVDLRDDTGDIVLAVSQDIGKTKKMLFILDRLFISKLKEKYNLHI